MRVRSVAACSLSAALAAAASVAWATSPMPPEIATAPSLAVYTERAISVVVAACCSTADAIVVWMLAISSITPTI